MRNSGSKPAMGVLDHVIGSELPVRMGKLISHLELQGPFQSLGRYVRSFEDTEFVVRKLKDALLSKLSGRQTQMAYAAICNLIDCSHNITTLP